MTAGDGLCDICGYPPSVGVASVPAFPVSLAWCPTCLMYGVIPMFCVESIFCDGDMTLPDTVEKHGVDRVLYMGADWFRETHTYVRPQPDTSGPGYYIEIGEYIRWIGRHL